MFSLRNDARGSPITPCATTRPYAVAGVNRSAAIVVGYIIVQERMTLLDAVRCAFTARPIILSNTGFVEQLIALAMDHGQLGSDADWEKIAVAAVPPPPPPHACAGVMSDYWLQGGAGGGAGGCGVSDGNAGGGADA